MKKIGIYPGSFQPATRAHLEAYKRLKSVVGTDCFIATTDREPTSDAPLNFGDKQQIWTRHGVPSNNIIRIASLPTDEGGKSISWRPKEIFNNFSSKQTIAICVFNEMESLLFRRKGTTATISGMSAGTIKEIKNIFKELSGEKQSGETWVKPDGSAQYFQPYKGNEQSLRPFEEHTYVMILDDSKIQGKPTSTKNIRNVLGSTRYDENKKKKFFRWVFGWFDIGLYQLMTTKFKKAHQVASPGDETLTQSDVIGLTTETLSHIPKRKLENMVYEILDEIMMDEDYSTTINEPDSTTDNITAGVNGEKSPAQQRADANKAKQDLVKKKGQAERDLKGLKTDLDWKKSDILRKRKDELPNKRKELDDLNKQLAAVSSTTATTSISNN